MNEKQVNHSSFNKYVKELTHTTYAIDFHYQIWLIYKKDRPKYVNIMNRYLGFFGPSIAAHFTTILIGLYNLYSLDKNTINYSSFIDFAEKNKVLPKNTIAEIKDLLKTNEVLISKIRILRCNHFAHINKKLEYDETLKKIKIKYDNFKDLIEMSFKILNRINYVSRSFQSKNDTSKLLEDLSIRNHCFSSIA